MQLDTLVTLSGVAAGTLLVVAAAVVFISSRAFSTTGAVVAVVGMILIGMSQWASISVQLFGATIELVKDLARETQEIAEQVREVAEAADDTRVSLEAALEATTTLVAQLQRGEDVTGLLSELVVIQQELLVVDGLGVTLRNLEETEQTLREIATRDVTMFPRLAAPLEEVPESPR